MSMFKNLKSDAYPVSVFDRLTNSKKLETKCDLETFKIYIKRDLENLFNTRCLYSWRSLHSKEKQPKILVKEGDDPNAPDKGKDIHEIFGDKIIAKPEDKEPQRIFLNFFEYGLSDYSTSDLSQESKRDELAEEIQAKIESFIPHLKNIKVKIVTEERNVKILIDAALNIGDESEEIEFDTSITQDGKVFSVKIM